MEFTKTEHLDGKVTLYGGDNRDVLKSLDDNSIDSIVTDPPYALVSIQKRFGGAETGGGYAVKDGKSMDISRTRTDGGIMAGKGGFGFRIKERANAA